MKAVVFAGGIGTRLWPISRKRSPKQFQKIIGEKSTLQLTVERLFPEFKPEDIYIATGKGFIEAVHEQLPMIPQKNIITEPAMRDVGPAVSFMMAYLEEEFPKEPVLILWSDHLIKREHSFKKIVQAECRLVAQEPETIVFIGQKARFASENLGWIHMGDDVKHIDGVSFKQFMGLQYRPDKTQASEFFRSDQYCWNLGYFVSTPMHITNLFRQFSPSIYEMTQKILSYKNKPEFDKQFEMLYSQMPKINFDNAVLEKMDKNNVYVVVDDIGWSDVGAWEALKEALEEKKDDNITKGNVLLEDTRDTLVYNYEDKKLVVGVDLDDILIVNTGDVLLVAKKHSISKIKQLVEGFNGTDKDSLT